MTVHYQRIPSTDPHLNRHIRHDDRSRAFTFDTSGLSIVSARHTRRIPVLDQGDLGSCTGNAGIGCLGTEPYYGTLLPSRILTVQVDGRWHHTRSRTLPRYTFDEPGAVQLYSDATRLDDYPGGYYAPNWQDTGSDGLSIARALKAAGEIAGYTHTFSLDDALKALTVTPAICGVTWYDTMFNPDPDGRVYPVGIVAGGHEICADEIDAEREQVWLTNSWGAHWGVGGRFYLSFDDFGKLLADQGDVTIFTPLTQPAPTPTPPAPVPTPGDPDAAFAAVLRHHDWVHLPHVADNARVAAAGRAWLRAKGL